MAYSLVNAIIILIHGTWGTSSDWHQHGGHFHDILSLQAEKRGARVVPFCWSGANTNEARETAAHALCALITSYPIDVRLYLIGHSHGGNVATRASQLLTVQKSQHTVDSIYLLGTPARADYFPNMERVQFVYNMISFQDYIQPIGGACDRAHKYHPRITNFSITIDEKEPGHTEMHHYSIALWLLHMDYCMRNTLDNFTHFKSGISGIIHFYGHQEPIYYIDPQWEIKIAKDKQLQERIIDTILKNKGPKSTAFQRFV